MPAKKHRYVYVTSEKLWPLSQFRLTNPCKKCLVSMRCSSTCQEYAKYKSLRYNIKRRYNRTKRRIKETTLYDIFEMIIICLLSAIFVIGSIMAFVIIGVFSLALVSIAVEAFMGAI